MDTDPAVAPQNADAPPDGGTPPPLPYATVRRMLHLDNEKFVVSDTLKHPGAFSAGMRNMAEVFTPSAGDFKNTPYAKLMGEDGILSCFMPIRKRESVLSVEHHDRAYGSSTGAEVLCTRFSRSGNRGFAFAVTTKAAGNNNGREVLLALHGTYDRSDKGLTIDRIYMPFLDNTNTIRPMSSLKITPVSIAGALCFADKITERALRDESLNQQTVNTTLRQVKHEKKTLADITASSGFAENILKDRNEEISH